MKFYLILFINFVAIVSAAVVREDFDSDINYHPIPKNSKEKILTLPTSPTTTECSEELHSEYWRKLGQAAIVDRITRKLNTKIAKNVIFFLGDGMSIATTTTARNLIGGEKASLSFENFPYTGLSKTYCVDLQVSDSACTATAYLTGVKSNGFTTGVNAKVKLNDCIAGLDETTHTESIANWAMEAGKSAGLVTTTRVTHASPSGLYAHVANRMWEDDSEIVKYGCNPAIVDDIAKQLIYGDGKNLSVILGGGRRNLLSNLIKDEEGYYGSRIDGKNLINEWLNDGKKNKKYVWNRKDLLNLKVSKTDYLLGLFESSDMLFNLQTKAAGLSESEPTLSEMTEVAINILNKNSKGFFLFVEGGRIDHGHHAIMPRVALDETIEFSKAVQKARQMLSEEDTLIVVSADHSHTMTMAGYPTRGNDIFGETGFTGDDGLEYKTLGYANGPQEPGIFVTNNGKRIDPKTVDTSQWYARFPTMVNASFETHAGEDVAVYASGPFAHYFTGNYEQHFIPHFMAYASCIGHGLKACK